MAAIPYAYEIQQQFLPHLGQAALWAGAVLLIVLAVVFFGDRR